MAVNCTDAVTGRQAAMDEACLMIANNDKLSTLQVWLQSAECYQCSYWLMRKVPPLGNSSLVVNTTYTTEFSIKTWDQNLHRFDYHFRERATYLLSMDYESHSMLPLSTGINIYLPLLYAFIFFVIISAAWCIGNYVILKRKNGSDPEHHSILQNGVQNGYGLDNSIKSAFSGIKWTSSPVDKATSVATASGSQQHCTDSGISRLSTNSSTTDLSSNSNAPHDSLDNSSTNETISTVDEHPPRYNDVMAAEASTKLGGVCLNTAIATQRLISLDVFRGIAIFLMVFVNYGGGKYHFFQHAPWNGLTIADLPYPWFMWIMGVSIIYSIKSQVKKGYPRTTMSLKVVKRSVILFTLGLFINSICDGNNISTLRIPGVLQRISFAYFMNGFLEIAFLSAKDPDTSDPDCEVQGDLCMDFCGDFIKAWRQWTIVSVIFILQVGITFVMNFLPACPRGYNGPGGLQSFGQHFACTGGAAAYIDKAMLGREHLYKRGTWIKVYGESSTRHDPEGILGSLNAVLLVQLGVQVGRILMAYKNHSSRVLRFVVWGSVCALWGGFLCGFEKEGGRIPVNKNLWSLSYVYVTAAFAFFLFALCYVLVDWLQKWDGVPFKFAGMNSLLIFVGHELVAKFYPFSWQPISDYHGSWLFMNLFGTCLWGVIAYACHQKKLYITV